MAPPAPTTAPRWKIVDFDAIPPVECSCGTAHRAFGEVAVFPATIHRTFITTDALTHYHKRQTETYYILDCDPDAKIELDGELYPLRPGMCVMIPPGVRHRGVGRITILNIVIPKNDPADEFFD